MISAATKSAIRRRRASVSGGSAKSIFLLLEAQPAIDDKDAAGHIGAGIGGEQQKRALEVGMGAKAALGNACDQPLADRPGYEALGHLTGKIAGADRIDPDLVPGELESERPGHMHESGLRCGIADHLLLGLEDEDRGDVDDAAPMAEAH